jgi:hypothetical protein
VLVSVLPSFQNAFTQNRPQFRIFPFKISRFSWNLVHSFGGWHLLFGIFVAAFYIFPTQTLAITLYNLQMNDLS